MSEEQLKQEIAKLQKQVEAQQDLALRAQELEKQLKASKQEDRVVYISKDSSKIPKLKGKNDEDDEWIDDVRHYMGVSRLNDDEKLEFILQHLWGTAKSEVKFRIEGKSKTPESVLGIIQAVFGQADSVSALQEAFWKRNQQSGELVLEYSLELLKLHSNITKKDKNFGGTSMLKGKFTEGVREDFLRRELRSLNIQSPGLEFWELRDRAIQWLGDDSEISGARKKSASTAIQQTKTADSSNPQANMGDMVDILRKQQEQINDLVKMMATLKQNNSATVATDQLSKGTAPTTQRRDRGRNQEGQRVCYRCRKTDHLVADCPCPAPNKVQDKTDKTTSNSGN